MNAVKEAPDYLHDEHLSQGTKTYLNVLNGGGPAVRVAARARRATRAGGFAGGRAVDLSGVEESERTVESEGRTLRLNLVRPEGTAGNGCLFSSSSTAAAGCWVIIRPTAGWCAIWSRSRVARRFSSTIRLRPKRGFRRPSRDLHCREMGGRKRP